MNLGTLALLYVSSLAFISRLRHLWLMANCWLYLQLCSPGSCFFLPHGARIYNKLMDFMRQQYRVRGYQEVYISLLLLTQLDYRHLFNSTVFVLYAYLIGVEPKYVQYATLGNFWTRCKLQGEHVCFWGMCIHRLCSRIYVSLLYITCVIDSSVSYNICWVLVGSILVQIEKQKFGLKPMNCPGHCLMFANRVRSYRGEFLPNYCILNCFVLS